MFETIRQAIIDLLNSDAITKIAVAYRTDRSQLDKYPAAIVSPTEVESDYFQTAPKSNKETYIFTIRILEPFVEGQDNADIVLEKAVDELIGKLRDRNVLGNLPNNGGSVADWVEPVPSVWGYQERPNGTMRVAELKVRAIKHVEPS